MTATGTTITFDEDDLVWARKLVEEEMYPSIEAAIRGELSQAREMRETERRLMLEELKRRLDTPADQFIRGRPGYFLERFREKHGLGDGFDG